MQKRRTKIVATIGPASSSPEVIEKLILAGMDVARLNFSHGSPEDHRQRTELIRNIAARHKRRVAIMGDLQGPKIRIAQFTHNEIELVEGEPFILSNLHPGNEGNNRIVGIDYPSLPSSTVRLPSA